MAPALTRLSRAAAASALRRVGRRTPSGAAVAETRRRYLWAGPGALRHGYKNDQVDVSTAVHVTFVLRDGTEAKVMAPRGRSILDIAHANEIELEGACEGSLACSTCHVYVDEHSLGKLEEPCDDENDMLDLAFALAENSRLGCQVCATQELDGICVTLPPATRNMAVDGFVPQPH